MYIVFVTIKAETVSMAPKYIVYMYGVAIILTFEPTVYNTLTRGLINNDHISR